jgi:hypothetical protein
VNHGISSTIIIFKDTEMKALLALFVALTFAATAFAAGDPPCKPGQDPKKDHCTAPK